MDNSEKKQLCIALAKAESEEKVVKILARYDLWERKDAWKLYGGKILENNFSIIGNQQSSADSALVEKLINSVDAVLMSECLKEGIDPESKYAPKSLQDAQKKYFQIFNGKLSNLDALSRTQLAKNIILVASGKKSSPCYSIIDQGEGQTPNAMPNTFLSLARSNKQRIPFVQGKHNMGGTGAFQFCGKKNIQLIISKRNPEIASKEKDPSGNKWGFTIIRREYPEKGMKSSTFKYLALNGKIIRFDSEQGLPLIPDDYPELYIKKLKYGTFLKLYNYQIGRYRTVAILDLYYRLSLLLPSIALPVRIYERRKGYKAHYYETNLAGIRVRLYEDKGENIEKGFPSSSEGKIGGEKMDIMIYVFKRGKKENYAPREGIIFTINGQTHGAINKTFFGRKPVGMDYIKDDILVIIDCSNFSKRKIEDLFMNSRDRLREGDYLKAIERHLEELINQHSGLRHLRNKRRKEDIGNKLEDSKPLAETLEKIIKKSPTLSKLLIEGTRIASPFIQDVLESMKEFKGTKFPNYFKINKKYDKYNTKKCPINKKFRVQFETDVENNYFSRENDPGNFKIYVDGKPTGNYSLNLWNGLATLNVKLQRGFKIGDKILYNTEVNDISTIKPFRNNFYVEVEPKKKKNGGKKGDRIEPPGEKDGKDRKKEGHLNLPEIIECRESDKNYQFKNNESGSLIIKDSGEEGYDFFINLDNIFLKSEIKTKKKKNPRLLEAKFKYGMVLVGLSLIDYFEKKAQVDKEEFASGLDRISNICSAISPVLIPMIDSLGMLELEKSIRA